MRGVRPLSRKNMSYWKDERQFRQVAAEYCGVIEQSSTIQRRLFLERIQETLAGLYALATRLPHVRPATSDAGPDRITHDQWHRLYKEIGARLGEADHYRMVFDPADPTDSEAIVTTLSDDLADIYRDLKDALPVGGDETVDADRLWALRWSFETHWGQHALSALTAIHALLHGPSQLVD
jgi:hypothetical protein